MIIQWSPLGGGVGAAAITGTIGTIAPGQTFARYLAVQLWPTPTTAITYHVDFMRVIPEMVNATDEPLLPEDYHWLLIEGALQKEWTKKNDDRRKDAKIAFDEGIKSLRSWVLTNPDTVASLRPIHASRQWSQLGPSYPAGS